MEKAVDKIVASDIHVGASTSKSDEFIEMLKLYDFEMLILLGDILHQEKFNPMKQEQRRFIRCLRKILKDGKKIIWCRGNNDSKLTELVRLLTGIEMVDEYRWKTDGKKYIALHGHIFSVENMKNESLAYCIKEDVNFVICGHSHKATNIKINDIGYYNCGSWIYEKLTYIVIDKNGKHLRTFKPEKNQKPLK